MGGLQIHLNNLDFVWLRGALSLIWVGEEGGVMEIFFRSQERIKISPPNILVASKNWDLSIINVWDCTLRNNYWESRWMSSSLQDPNQNNAEETLLRKCSRTMEQPVKNLESCSHYESQEERAWQLYHRLENCALRFRRCNFVSWLVPQFLW